jgi:hypothetical protein
MLRAASLDRVYAHSWENFRARSLISLHDRGMRYIDYSHAAFGTVTLRGWRFVHKGRVPPRGVPTLAVLYGTAHTFRAPPMRPCAGWGRRCQRDRPLSSPSKIRRISSLLPAIFWAPGTNYHPSRAKHAFPRVVTFSFANKSSARPVRRESPRKLPLSVLYYRGRLASVKGRPLVPL